MLVLTGSSPFFFHSHEYPAQDACPRSHLHMHTSEAVELIAGHAGTDRAANGSKDRLSQYPVTSGEHPWYTYQLPMQRQPAASAERRKPAKEASESRSYEDCLPADTKLR